MGRGDHLQLGELDARLFPYPIKKAVLIFYKLYLGESYLLFCLFTQD